jgi:hypothetical protein
VLIVRLVLGLVFLVFCLNAFLQFLKVGGPRKTWLRWNCEPTLQTDRARMVTLHLPLARPRSIPITTLGSARHGAVGRQTLPCKFREESSVTRQRLLDP